MISTEQMWDRLRDDCGVSDETLRVVSCINGYSRDTMEAVLYAVTGLRSFGQIDDDDD